MGDINLNNGDNSKRKEEKLVDEYKIARIIGKIHTILKNPTPTIEKIREFYQRLSFENLQNGEGNHSDYYFSGKNLLERKKLNGDNLVSEEALNCNSIDMFKNVDLLEDMINREGGLSFDCDLKSKKIVDNLSESLINNDLFEGENPIIDDISKKNFFDILIRAKKENKKIVILANHASHFDAAILNFIYDKLFEKIKEEYPEMYELRKKVRFICGSYMYYNKGVRSFNVAFNTSFVFGPKDLKEIISFLSKQGRRDLIVKIGRQSVLELEKNKETEMSLLFPYAGRSDSSNGCKEEFPKGIMQYLGREECIYLPMGFIGSSEIFPTGSLYKIFKKLIPLEIIEKKLDNINMFKFLDKYKYKHFKSSYVFFSIGEGFVGGEKKSDEINEIIHKLANKSLDKFGNIDYKL